jgi:signal transduction histidine kinase/CheY-like chemotaxis protein
MSLYTSYDLLFVPVIILNANGELVYFNNQSSIFFKLPPRLLKQKTHLHQICTSPDLDIEIWIKNAIKGKEVLVSPEMMLKLAQVPELEYFINIQFIPLNTDEDHNYVLVFHDLTVEKNLHIKYRQQLEELKKTHKQILQADKLTTIGELTANISHEINNPLTIASGHSEIIRDYLNSHDVNSKIPNLQLANNIVLESLERVNQIIKNMKDFLHQSEDQKEYCNLESLLDAAIEWIDPAARKLGVEIHKEINGQKIVALANHIKIEQVFINLIKNAIDAFEENKQTDGKVTIKFSKNESDQLTIIDIIDNGPGLPAVIRENLFKPFTSTKDAGHGTGMGLSICQKIMESHKGKLEFIESDKGCNFRLSLPLIEIYSYTRNDKSLSGPRQKKRILVLDNEVQILNVLNSFIQEDGLVFIGSSDPYDALEFLQKAAIDLIITDISMPIMTGGDFAARARKYGYEGTILYMTGQKFIDQYNKDKKELDIKGLILKPFSKEDVMKTIHQALKDQGANP